MSQTNSKELSDAELKELHHAIQSGFRGILEQFDQLDQKFALPGSEQQSVIGQLDQLIEKGDKIDRSIARSELHIVRAMRGTPPASRKRYRHSTVWSVYGPHF